MTGTAVQGAVVRVGVTLTVTVTGAGGGTSPQINSNDASGGVIIYGQANISFTKTVASDTVAWTASPNEGSFGDATLVTTTYTPATAPSAGTIALTATLTKAKLETPTATITNAGAVSWNAVTGATSYTIKVYKGSGTTALVTLTGKTGTSYSLTNTDIAGGITAAGTDYCVTVTASGGSNYTDSDESAKSSGTFMNVYSVALTTSGYVSGDSVSLGGTAVTSNTTTTVYAISGSDVAFTATAGSGREVSITGSVTASGSITNITENKTIAAAFSTAVTPAYTVTAAAASNSPVAGASNQITLTVKDSAGNTDTTFTGSKTVALTGVQAALSGTDYGTLGTTAITSANVSSVTVSVNFTNGVGMVDLKLAKAAAQTLTFSVTGVNTPAASAIIVTPTYDTTASTAVLAITTQPAAPSANSGTLATQPVLTVKDQYGNPFGSGVAVVASAKNTAWTIGGTTSVNTSSSGTVIYTNLTAGHTAAVNGAVITFTLGGSKTIDSDGFDIPAPTVNGISIKTPPSNLTYTHGNTLNLSGLEVTLSYNNSTTKDVALGDFGTNSITTSISDGATLSRTTHNNQPVTVIYNNSSTIRVDTSNLTVNAKTLIGTVTITGDTKYGAILTANTSGSRQTRVR